METKNIEFIKKYYSDPKIRELLFAQAKNYNYCIGAGKSLIEKGWTFPVKEVPIEQLPELLDECLDLFFPIRPKEDKDLYIIWDIEYFNKENPKFIFDRENQKKIFEWMSPALKIVEDILRTYQIKYLIDITMSGIHVWSKISTKSPTFANLAEEGYLSESLIQKYSQSIPSDRKRITPTPLNLGRAYNTAGKILEFFSHILIKQNKKENPFRIPVTISDTPQFGEYFPYSGVSSDLSQYAHPIYMRCIRAFCSTHQKSLINGFESLGPAVDIVKIPGLSYQETIEIMWDRTLSTEFYKNNFSDRTIEVEESSEGWQNAFNDYLRSELRQCHKEWEKSSAVNEIPAEQKSLISPYFTPTTANPALLTPQNLQTLAEITGNNGVEVTKKVFNIVAEYYSNNAFGWYDPNRFTGINWSKYDAVTAADFWGRIYWSLRKMGLGREFNNKII